MQAPLLNSLADKYAIPAYMLPSLRAAIHMIVEDVRQNRQSFLAARSLTLCTTNESPLLNGKNCLSDFETSETVENTSVDYSPSLHRSRSVLAGTQMQLNEILHNWTEAFYQSHLKYAVGPTSALGSIAAPGTGPSSSPGAADLEFSEAYRALMHSPACSTLLQLEQSYAVAVRELIGARESSLSQLNKVQTRRTQGILQRMTNHAGSPGPANFEAELDKALVRHQEEMEMATVKWASELSVLRGGFMSMV